jgi:quercetin dioxygenase-like cupin family protein
MKRPVRWALLMVGLAGLVAVLTVAPGAATPPSGLTNVPLARGTNMSGNIPLQVGTDVAMAQITVNPAGFSGWHSHPGGAIIVVQTGTLTVYRSLGSHCHPTTYSAGQAFIERPGEVDDVLNNGTIPYILYVTF